MSPSDNWLSGEPPVTELMADPIFHMVMRRDHLHTDDVWRTLHHVRQRLHPHEEHSLVKPNPSAARSGPQAAAAASGLREGAAD